MTISRRTFLVSAAGAGAGLGLGAFSHQFPLAPPHLGPDWRPGVETFVASTCLLCPAHCGIRARLIDGALTRIDGNPLHPVSQGGLCPKGHAGIQLVYHPGRLTGPVQRVGPPGSDRFEPITWDAALDRIAAALKKTKEQGQARSVEWMVGDVRGAMADLVAAFCSAYGSNRLTVDDRRDGSTELMKLSHGIDAEPAYDLTSSDFVLSFGAALSESWAALPLAARARGIDAQRRHRWVQVDARLSRTALAADDWIAIRPGTYGTLALGIAYLLAKEGLYDADFVSERVAGWDDWTDERGTRYPGFRSLVLRHGAPDDVSSATGIPIPRLIELAKAFGIAERPVAIWDHAVSWRRGGLADALAIHTLNVLRGSLNRPGGVLVQSRMTRPGPIAGSRVGTGSLSAQPLSEAAWPARSGDGSPPTQVLFLYLANPVASAARSEEARRALSQVPLVVSFSPFLDESARYAHLVLPDHTYLERWQDAPAPAAVPYPVWGVVRPVMPPRHNTRGTGDVMLALATRLGSTLEPRLRWSSMEEIVRERAGVLAAAQRGSAFVEGFRQNELRELEARGYWLPHGDSPGEYAEQILDRGGWFDPLYSYGDRTTLSGHQDGRVWIFPAAARRRLQDSGDNLREGFLPSASDAGTSGAGDPFPLRLMPYRVLTLASGSTNLMPWLLEHLGVLSGSAWEPWAEINPLTARNLGVRDGQRVRVESSHGGFEAILRVLPGAQPGLVNVPYGLHAQVPGWGTVRVVNPLAAVGGQIDSVTGLPDWYSTRVRLVAI